MRFPRASSQRLIALRWRWAAPPATWGGPGAAPGSPPVCCGTPAACSPSARGYWRSRQQTPGAGERAACASPSAEWELRGSSMYLDQ